MDWQTSLDQQLDLYEYLQTSQGAFAAGVTNSWNKVYGDPPQEYKVSHHCTFSGLLSGLVNRMPRSKGCGLTTNQATQTQTLGLVSKLGQQIV